MDTKFFFDPFAVSGNRTTVPDTVQPDGSVSYRQGYGPDYSLDPDADPDALLINRQQFNEILYQVTAALGAVQQDFPQWVSAADNDGTPLAYKSGAVVRYNVNGLLYQSLVAANVATPGTDATKWSVFLSAYATAAALAAETAARMAADALLAPINNPEFTGSPRAPTPTPGTGGNLLATCAYVLGAVQSETNRAVAAEALLAPVDSPTFTGSPQVPAVPTNDNSLRVSSTAYVFTMVEAERVRALAAENLLAPLASPALTGTPTAPTPPGNSNDTTIPNTAWIQALIANLFNNNVPGFNPTVPGSFQWGAFTIRWAAGPYDPGDNSEPSRFLSWDAPFGTACLVAFVSCDLAGTTANMDSWYQTAGWNQNGVTVQRQRGNSGSWSMPTRAVAFGFGF